MAGSLNKVQLIGNLGNDPEVRTLESGARVVNFSIATSESWKDKNSGEKKEHTEWHRIVIWNDGLGKIAEQYLKKGSKCFVEGQMQTRKWQDKDGVDRYSTEVVLSGFGCSLLLLGDSGGGSRASDPNDNASRPGNNYAEAHGKGPAPQQRSAAGRDSDMRDDIPF